MWHNQNCFSCKCASGPIVFYYKVSVRHLNSEYSDSICVPNFANWFRRWFYCAKNVLSTSWKLNQLKTQGGICHMSDDNTQGKLKKKTLDNWLKATQYPPKLRPVWNIPFSINQRTEVVIGTEMNEQNQPHSFGTKIPKLCLLIQGGQSSKPLNFQLVGCDLQARFQWVTCLCLWKKIK